ncbi:MAG: tol-pal system protein YbgF [Betaproteobacteria bacterium]|nr:tol-pal system protein YbgF [Betaproteobacteria bacterium]
MRRGLPVLLLWCAAGAAHAGLFDDDEARKQVADLRTQLFAQVDRITADQKALDERLTRMESAQRDRALDLAQMIDGLKQELARMRGQIEVLVNQAQTIERRQKDLYVDMDTRLRKLEQVQNQAAEKAAQAEREAQAEKQAYEAALNQFKVGNYQSAIAAFQTFMVNFANSPLVPSAQYWVGNSYFALRDYKVAIAAQEKLVKSWPDNPKAPDALLNMASAQAELGDQKAARETLRVLMQKYPGSPAADQAKQRLQRR